jgi:hypothetical protein
LSYQGIEFIMKTKQALLLAVLALCTLHSIAEAQGTAFTYQGRLNTNGVPVNGFYDFEFSLWTNAAGTGTQTGSTITQTAIGVTNGLFVTTLNFGAVFTGNATWLAISTRSNGVGGYTPMTPLQALTPAPYAIFAEGANATGLTGTITLAQLPSAVVTNNETSVQLASLTLTSNLTLPSPPTIDSGGNSLLYADNGDNFYIGPNAGSEPSLGSDNTGVGYGSLQNNTAGTNNTAMGFLSLANNTNGTFNVAIGGRALTDNTSGTDNTAVGRRALEANTTGTDNTAVGFEALTSNPGGSFNIALGSGAGSGFGNYENSNIDIGNNGVGGDNNIIRIGSGQTTTYIAGVINGNGAGLTNLNAAQFPSVVTNGEPNVTLGTLNLSSPAIIDSGGLQILYNGPNFNFYAGLYAGNPEPTTANTAVGYFAFNENLEGSNNSAFGKSALTSNADGNNNSAMGEGSMADNDSGSDNVAFGASSLANSKSGSYNIALGYQAGNSFTGSESSNIDIGNVGVAGEYSTIRIGTPGTQTSTYLSGNVAFDGGLNIDKSGTYGQNSGSVSAHALTFGTGPGGSGEGIASQRTSGPNQFDLALYTGFNPRLTVMASGNVGIGTTSPGALLEVNGNTIIDDNLSAATITSSGAMSCCSITINGGCDVAEPFEVSSPSGEIPEGSVVVIDEKKPGHLKVSSQAYDTRVAGVLSGANGISPGIQMQQQGLIEGGKNVALTGRVYVLGDASYGEIKPGDLLTTSATPGHAMKVSDHAKASGAILGKAMGGLKRGRGMVLVLVTLQ